MRKQTDTLATMGVDDLKATEHARHAIQLRDQVSRMLRNNFEIVWKRSCELNPISQETITYVLNALPISDITLWRVDFARCAVDNGNAFKDEIPKPELLPRRPRFWVYYGGRPSLPIGNTEYEIGATVLIPSEPFELLVVAQLLFKEINGSLDLGSLRVIVDGALELGQPTGLHRGHEVYSCLTFMDSRIAACVDIPLSRPEIRRLEKSKTRIPDVKLVHLRRREKSDRKETTNDSDSAHKHRHHPNREYHYQWLVDAHVRKPNARMKEQCPIWVRGYIKGPADKPLKTRPTMVTVVKR